MSFNHYYICKTATRNSFSINGISVIKLRNLDTHFHPMNFKDGEVVYADWMPQKDQDTGKIQSNVLELL